MGNIPQCCDVSNISGDVTGCDVTRYGGNLIGHCNKV